MTHIEIQYRTGCIITLGDLHHDHYFRRGLDPFAAHGLDHSICWNADALIVAGDLAGSPLRNWPAAFAFLKRYMPPERTFVVAGNHDYYGIALDGDADLRTLAHAAGVQFVQKQELRHGSTRVFACTLWTDFGLTGTPEASMAAAGRLMRDYTAISKPDPDEVALPPDLEVWRRPVPITPGDTLAVHREHRHWLDGALRTPHFAGQGGRSVIVTHHGPHPASAGAIDQLSAAFHSNLADIIARHRPCVWFFGHSHRRLRATVEGTDIRNVSIGYPDEERTPGEQPLSDLCLLFTAPLIQTGAVLLLPDHHPLRLWSAGKMTTSDACRTLGLRDKATLLVAAEAAGLLVPMPPESEIPRHANLVETLLELSDLDQPATARPPRLSEAEWVAFLRDVKLPVLSEPGIGSGIRFADVPPELQAPFERNMMARACPVIHGERCAWLHDWKLFLHLQSRRALHALHLVSLRLGAEGPGEADLQTAPRLSDWIVVRDPQFGGAILIGTPTGHPTCRGPLMHSSRLCGIDPAGSWARTASRWYRLTHISTFGALVETHGARLSGSANLVLTLNEAQEVIKSDQSTFGKV